MEVRAQKRTTRMFWRRSLRLGIVRWSTLYKNPTNQFEIPQKEFLARNYFTNPYNLLDYYMV